MEVRRALSAESEKPQALTAISRRVDILCGSRPRFSEGHRIMCRFSHLVPLMTAIRRKFVQYLQSACSDSRLPRSHLLSPAIPSHVLLPVIAKPHRREKSTLDAAKAEKDKASGMPGELFEHDLAIAMLGCVTRRAIQSAKGPCPLKRILKVTNFFQPDSADSRRSSERKVLMDSKELPARPNLEQYKNKQKL